MKKITALKQQQRNQNRVSVFLDDEFAFGLPIAVMQSQGLRKGQELTDQAIVELQDSATVELGKLSAQNFLSYRPRSSAEVERNLKQKGYEPDVIEKILVWLSSVDLLDDIAFTRYWVEQREAFKPRSHYALQQELRQKGIPTTIIETVLEEVDELASAQRAAEKRADRFAHLPPAEFRKKLGRYLQSRGFNYGLIRQVTDEQFERLSAEGNFSTEENDGE